MRSAPALALNPDIQGFRRSRVSGEVQEVADSLMDPACWPAVLLLLKCLALHAFGLGAAVRGGVRESLVPVRGPVASCQPVCMRSCPACWCSLLGPPNKHAARPHAALQDAGIGGMRAIGHAGGSSLRSARPAGMVQPFFRDTCCLFSVHPLA